MKKTITITIDYSNNEITLSDVISQGDKLRIGEHFFESGLSDVGEIILYTNLFDTDEDEDEDDYY